MKPETPKHLAPATREWFASVVSGYVLEQHHIRILTLAGEAWDRCQQAREQLAKEGLTVKGRESTKVHPCVAIERDSRAAFARLVAQLGLDDIEAGKRGPGRPAHGFGVTFEQLNGLPEPPPHGKRARRI